MARSRPVKLLKVLGCLAALLLLIGLGVGGAVLLMSSFDVQHREQAEGAAAIDEALARFAGSRPYVDLVRRDGLISTNVHHEREPEHPAAITRVHGLLWEEVPGRLVRASTPAWVLDVARWKNAATAPLLQPLEKQLGLEVSLPDLSPFGPGLLVDHHGAHGRRLVIWAEGD